MRMAVVVVISLTLLAGSGWADEIYRWTDAGGHVHFSNTPTTGATPAGLQSDESAAPADDGGGTAAATDEGAAFSTGASLRRNALEREMRANDRRLQELDGRLGTLGRARTANGRGSAATGGLGSLAGDVRSEEERALADQRAQVAQRADDLQAEYAKLREEVTSRFGTTPAWWVEVRGARR